MSFAATELDDGPDKMRREFVKLIKTSCSVIVKCITRALTQSQIMTFLIDSNKKSWTEFGEWIELNTKGVQLSFEKEKKKM